MEIRLKLEGERISDGSIDARALGGFLLNFQSLLDKLSQKIVTGKPRTARETTRAYLKEIRKGSVELIFNGGPQISIDETGILKQSYGKILAFAEAISISQNDARNLLLKELTEPIPRLKVETGLRNIRDVELSVTFFGWDNSTAIPLDRNKMKVIDDWIKEDEKYGTREVRGAIVRLKADEPNRYFSISDEKGKMCRCHYPPELEDRIIDLFKKPVKVRGVIERKVRTPEISDVIDIMAWDSLEIEHTESFKLRKTISCKISFDEDLWALSNDDLSIHGIGFTFEEALRDFEEDLEGAIELYVHRFSINELSRDALDLREKLLSYIGEAQPENI